MPSAARSRQRGCRSGSSNSSSSRPGAWRQARLAHPLLAAVLAAGALLAGVPPAAAATPFPQFPVNWTNVPDTPQPAADLSSSCICALLNGTCTPGCCCDPACPPAVVSGHRAARSCLPEGPPPEQLTYCLPDEPFAHVNLPGGDFYKMQRQSAELGFLSQLLCVAADRNPSLGTSYPDPAAGDVGSNAREAACPPQPMAASNSSISATASSYGYGQAVAVEGVIAPAVAGVRARGTFVLPVGVLSAECADLQEVGFMGRLPSSLKASASRCTRTFATPAALTAMCSEASSPLSPTFWAGLRFPPNPAASGLQDVELTSLQRLTVASGVLTPLNAVSDLDAPTPAAGPPAACSGVVLEAHFVMRTATDPASGAHELAGVQLSLVVADVAMPAPAAGGGPLVLDTAFSVAWADAAVPDGALQPLSGAPGYLPGFPLLASLAATAPAPTGAGVLRQAVSRLRGGLQLPGPGPAGRCSPSRVYSTPVGWGYNLTSTCSVGLTLSQLRALCTANTPARPLADVLGAEWLGNLTSQQLLLGVWGNSDPANIAAWLPLAASGWPPATDAVWDEAASTCHNMATGLQVRLLTGVAFASGNLQPKLLFGSACVSYGAWRYDRLNGPPLQAFPLTFGATFVRKAGQVATLAVKPAPPLIRPLPRDLFWPFTA